MTSTARPLRRAAASLAAVLLLAGCTIPGLGGDQGPDDGGTDPGVSDGGGSAGSDGGGDDGGAHAGPPSTNPGGLEGPLPELRKAGTSAAELDGDPAEDPAYASYYEQEISWGPCEDLDADGAECGMLTVPRQWNDPEAGDIEIAVAQIPASGEKQGSLVLNPGGPGGSGVNYLESVPYFLSSEVQAAYDVVGFDPRGVGRSAPVTCLDDRETDEFLASTIDPTTEEGLAEAEKWGRRVAEACEQNSGEILPFVDTWSAARDMDVLRAALDSEKLDYLGFSYGTYLGSSYAELHPDRVGKFVLDAAIDPSLALNQISAGQAEGFERAIEAFLQDCLDAGADACPVKGDVERAKQQLQSFFASVDESPLDSGDPDRPLTGALARSAVLLMMYQDELWGFGREALDAAMTGDGSQLLMLADLGADRQNDGSYRTNGTYAISAVNCLDHPGVADVSWVEQEAERLAEEYPTFGPMLGGDGCVLWPQEPVREPAPITAKGSAPIVVIGTMGDPATPYAWSQALAEQLENGLLLTFEGNGHTAYGRSGGCIEKEVDAYLLEGTVPEDGLVC